MKRILNWLQELTTIGVLSLLRGESERWGYGDVASFCKVATIEEVAKLNYIFIPGRYVGLADEEDDFNFVERFTFLKAELEKQIAEEADLNKKIAENLAKIILTLTQ